MKAMVFRFVRVVMLICALTLGGALALSAVPLFVLAQSDSDTPAAACGAGPTVVCPATDDPSAPYIASVTAVPDGVVILLTDAGLGKARECGGATEIATLAAALYATIPDDQRAGFQLDWKSEALADEIYGHAFFNELTSGLGGLGNLNERSNPINIVFADYGGPGEMTNEAGAEQTTFAALGALHRAAC
jgi:hypothetical protein